MAIKLLIADDDALIRESLKIILSIDKEFDVVSLVENGLLAVEQCNEKEIDVALLDVRMPVMNGVQAAKEIRQKTSTKVLILTTFDEDEYIKEAIKNGANGYLLKNNTPEKIITAIKMVHSGNSIIQNEVMEKIKEELLSKKSPSPIIPSFEKGLFTEREIEVMSLVAKGYSNKALASELYISEGTVKNYISSILNKTGLEHRTQIAIYYLQYDFSNIKK